MPPRGFFNIGSFKPLPHLLRVGHRKKLAAGLTPNIGDHHHPLLPHVNQIVIDARVTFAHRSARTCR